MLFPSESVRTNPNVWFLHIFTPALLDPISVNDISAVTDIFFFLFSEKQQILKLVYDHQLNALTYFAVKGNGTILIEIDDTASDVQALNLLNSSDLPYGPLQITGIVLEFCSKVTN